MPRQIRDKVGDIYRVRTVKTFGDKVKEIAQIAAGSVVIMVIAYLLLSQ